MADFQEYVEYEGEENTGVSSKTKLVVGLLAIFLGGWGVDLFYTGKTGLGFAQIGVTILLWPICFLCGFTIVLLPIGLILPFVWPGIRAVMAFMGKTKDSDGLQILN